MNYYRRYLGDYARDTRHLSMLEHGAYTMLMDTLYATEAPLPENDKLLFKICGASTKRERNAVKSVLSAFFFLKPNGFSQKRFEEELTKAESRTKASQENGKNGGRPRKQEPSENLEDNLEISSPSSNHHITTKHKTIYPANFALSAQMRSFAIDRGVTNPDAELEAFADHHKAKGSRFLDWEATWRTWCRNSEKFRARRSNGAESFDERRQRKSQNALGEIGARANSVVSQVGRRLPDPRGN